jgi:hypothetical protein
MTKNKYVPLSVFLLLGLIIFGIPSYAQLNTNKDVLQRASIAIGLKEREDFRKLLALSRQKGWPLTITNKSGRRAYLSGVGPSGYPMYIASNDLTSAATIKTNLLWPGGSTGLNLSGSSANMLGKIAIWDEDSVRPTHQELTGRILQKDKPTGVSDHSTHVSGIMIASGVNPQAKGMAFGAPQLIAYDFNNQFSEMAAESPNLLISNHSYGTVAGWNFNIDQNRWEFLGNSGDTADYKFGYYSSETQLWDSIAYNAPFYLIVKSAGNNRTTNGPAVGQPYWRYNSSGIMVSAGNRPTGISSNDGYDILPTYSTAKNILTVGAVNPVPGGYTQPSDVTLADFSSWGPTDDGRIKPDVVTDGVGVLSSVATTNNAYAIFDGTSMSSPAAAGSSFLLQEYYSKLHTGTFLRSATLKGIIIHTADVMGVSDGPNYQNGWGLMNMQKAAAVITSNNTDQLINENNLVNGASYTLPVVASGKSSLSATISWTDPAGSVNTTLLLNNRSKKLVNDLDLRIIGPDSTYMPWTLDPLNPGNAATTGDNVLDNVEKIAVPGAIPGQSYTIKVTHKGTLSRGQQAYSLVVSGVGGLAYCSSGPTSSAGTRIDSLNFSGGIAWGNHGCTTYTNNTNQTLKIQSNQTVSFSTTLGSCDATTASKVEKIFIDYNNNGSFNDAGEMVAQSPVINGNGSFNGTFTTPAGLTIGNFTLMRVVVVETTDPNAVTPCGTYGNGETQDYRVQVVQSGNDVGVNELVDPQASLCEADSQRITVRIKNFGTNTQVNVPISTIIKNGATTIASLNVICPDTIAAQSDVIYTFQAPFTAVAGATYTVTSSTHLTGDQDLSNDQNISSITVSTGSNPASGEAEICGNSAALKANVSDSNDVAAWYDSPTATKPVAAGNVTSTTVIPSNKTYYLGLNDIPTKVGPVNKKVFLSGGYNEFAGNFVKFTNNVPVTIKSARLYIGHAGKITFIAADIASYNPTTGSISYFPISTTTIDVYATTPSPKGGAVDGNNAADTGAVYFLNLPIPITGNHAIIIVCEDSANIFRNNNISSNPYPFTIPGVFSITGNSAINTANTADTTFYRNYYYFFYNMEIQLANCPGPRVPVVATTATAPVISLSGKTLSSSIASGNQWYRNDSALDGATGQTFDLTLPGIYTDVVTDKIGCSLKSNAITYTPGNGIGLTVSPNPSNGIFSIQFYVTEVSNTYITLTNALGQRVYSNSYPDVTGGFSQQINAGNLAAGIYFLKVIVGKQTYVKKILIN